MKKIVLTFGSIAGLIVVLIGFVTFPMLMKGTINFKYGAYVGFSTMIIALSLVFFGVKSYRDNHLGGTITFWKASQVGGLIALVASVIYAVGWEVSLHYIIPDFVDQYTAQCIANAKADNVTPEKMERVLKQVEDVRWIYKYPLLRFGMTMLELLVPVGVVMTLASAGLLRKKELLPAR